MAGFGAAADGAVVLHAGAPVRSAERGILARLVALFARSRVVQWAAVTVQLALIIGSLVQYWAT